MAFIVVLTVLLIAIQLRSLRFATNEAASAYMDATSTKVLGRLQGELSNISALVHVLATSSSVANSNERSEIGRAVPLFKAALQELPQSETAEFRMVRSGRPSSMYDAGSARMSENVTFLQSPKKPICLVDVLQQRRAGWRRRKARKLLVEAV